MPLPEPEPGLVISYAYVWHHEHDSGVEEGRKDRPCVILIAIERQQDNDTVVVALPVTHRPPKDATVAVEIPQGVKQQLGLDLERSWVVVNEGNQFVWPGYDLRKVPGRDQFHYGFLPPHFFDQILAAARAYRKHSKMTVTPR
jgi:PemK-like, MazF-like toxin of type II toxin-antitoxin system